MHRFFATYMLEASLSDYPLTLAWHSATCAFHANALQLLNILFASSHLAQGWAHDQLCLTYNPPTLPTSPNGLSFAPFLHYYNGHHF